MNYVRIVIFGWTVSSRTHKYQAFLILQWLSTSVFLSQVADMQIVQHPNLPLRIRPLEWLKSTLNVPAPLSHHQWKFFAHFKMYFLFSPKLFLHSTLAGEVDELNTRLYSHGDKTTSAIYKPDETRTENWAPQQSLIVREFQWDSEGWSSSTTSCL